MGIGNNARFVARMERREALLIRLSPAEKLKEIELEELKARCELTNPKYNYVNEKRKLAIRSRVMCKKLTRWI